MDSDSSNNVDGYNYALVESNLNIHTEEAIVKDVAFEDQHIANSANSNEIESISTAMIVMSNERKERLKNISWNSVNKYNGLESRPAYLRKNVQIDNVPHSSDSQVSRYTLSEGEDKKTEIKPNNSFLHDNVD